MSHHPDRNPYPNLYQHGDNHTPPLAFWSCTVGAALVLAYLIHGVLLTLNYRIPSGFDLFWNCFVWLMPSSLVLGLGQNISPSPASKDANRGISGSSEHAAKSEILRTAFNLHSVSKPATTFAASPPGLGNWNSSCYQNSVLQALASLRCLGIFFEHLRQNVVDLPDDTTIASLEDLINSLNNISNSGQHLWTPPKLKSMSSWQQQDAQEYFSKLVDAIEKDTIAALKRHETRKESGNTNSILSVVNCSEEKRTRDDNIQSSPSTRIPPSSLSRFPQIQNPLEGLLAQRVGCTRCGYSEGISLIPFNCVTLPLGRQWSYDIQDCFEEYTSLESIEGVECAKCSLLQMEHELRRQVDSLASLPADQENGPNEDFENYKTRLGERLEAVTEALQDENFSEASLRRKCQIPSNLRVSSTKSKQVTVMKPPQCLVMHVNRSLFDEQTEAQLKNYAEVQYPRIFDMSRWCIGNDIKDDLNGQLSTTEEWEMDPTRSMIAKDESFHPILDCHYVLRAVITHLGRHENGHYICYRNLAGTGVKACDTATAIEEEITENSSAWWRLSDENVSPVSEEEACSQGGAFMLFYERMDQQESCQAGNDESLVTENTKSAAPIYESMGIKETDKIQHESNLSHEIPVSDEGIKSVDINLCPIVEGNPFSLPGEDPPIVANGNSNDDACQSSRQKLLQDVPSSFDEAAEQETNNEPAAELRKRSLSPPRMRTAGIQRKTSQSSDPFKAMPMIATT